MLDSPAAYSSRWKDLTLGFLRFAVSIRDRMLVDHAEIDDQLAKIAATVSKHPHTDDGVRGEALLVSLVCWRQRTRRLRDKRARDPAWSTRRTQQALAKAMTEWITWLQRNRGVGAERAARKALAEASRLSRGLYCFRDACVRRKHRRRLKVALRALRTLTQRRPIERAWCCWQNTVRHMYLNSVLKAWAFAAGHQRQLEMAKQAVGARWQVIGPVRRAIEILRDGALDARAAQKLRHRRLRNGLNVGFTASVTDQRRSRSAIGRARGHYRLQALRASIHRWLVRHRLAQSVVRWQHRVGRARRRASIKIWANVTVIAIKKRHRAIAGCVRGFEQNAVRGRVAKRAMTTAAGRFRYIRLFRGVKQWHATTALMQKKQQSQGNALEFRHVKGLKEGLESFNRRIQATKALQETDNTRSARQARSLRASFANWQKRASNSQRQFNLEHSASLRFRHESLTAGISLWHKRTTYVVGVRLKTREFQLNLGLKRLCRRVEKRRVTRLGVWRAGVRAEAYGAAGAMKRWRRRAQAQRDLDASFRMVRNRSQTRKMVRAGCSLLGRTALESLKRHTRARKLERRALRAWASHAERRTQASKQARKFLLRSGLLRLHLWVQRSERRRDRCSKASHHRKHAVEHATFIAWKNKVYPLGMREQWSPRIHPCTKAFGARGAEVAGTHHFSVRPQEMGCLETAETETAQDSRGSSGYVRFSCLRLPMIRRRIRRVLFAWRKHTEKEKRFRHIRGALARKVARPVESHNGLANRHDYLNDTHTPRTRVRRCNQGIANNTRGPDAKRPGRRVGSKGYLHRHMPSAFHENALPST